jgi:hypothetical protein
MPLFAAYKAHCTIRVKTRPFIISTVVTIFLVLAASFFELNGDRMMFLEFKTEAKTIISAQKLPQLYSKWRISESDIQAIPPEIFNTREAFDSEGNLTLKKSQLEPAIEKKINRVNKFTGLQGLLRIATAYEVWKNTTAFSISRWFYALTFIAILGCGLQLFALVSTIFFVPDSIFNKNKYLTYLIINELGILLWVPFQSYSVEHTKSFLFSPEFRGDLAGINVLLYAILGILFPATFVAIYKSASKQYQAILLLFLSASLALTIASNWWGSSIINQLFGMKMINNSLTPWFASTIFFATVFFLVVRFIDVRLGDE